MRRSTWKDFKVYQFTLPNLQGNGKPCGEEKGGRFGQMEETMCTAGVF
jgi:hypothetical protein